MFNTIHIYLGLNQKYTYTVFQREITIQSTNIKTILQYNNKRSKINNKNMNSKIQRDRDKKKT